MADHPNPAKHMMTNRVAISCSYDGEIKAASGWISDPPERLTQAGRAMLVEIWEALGKPGRPLPPKQGFVPVDKLQSHWENRRSAAQVHSHLLGGGFLHVQGRPDDSEEFLTLVSPPWYITGLALSAKAFDALTEFRIIARPVA